MVDPQLTVAVTGLNATDNPGPGVSVIRSLRLHPDFRGRIVGLAYDTLEPGIYARDLVDEVYLIPYPSQGVEALERRLEYIHDRAGLSVVLPTLDSELPAFIALEPRLRELGIDRPEFPLLVLFAVLDSTKALAEKIGMGRWNILAGYFKLYAVVLVWAALAFPYKKAVENPSAKR